MKWSFPLLAAFGLVGSGWLHAQSTRGFVYMASTIGPIDSGILDVLEAAFEKDTSIRVRHVGAGTGAALQIARKGEIDLTLVHAQSLEEAFVAEGYGTERIPLMYNDFVIVGPPADPAGIKGMKSALDALQLLAAKGAPFITRGDQSGTHVAEMGLWAKANMKPAGAWYRVYDKGAEGNAATLRFTDAQKAYTVIDRASYLGLQKEIGLSVLVEGDAVLLNHISLIPVNPAKCPKANLTDAKAFVAWLTAADKGQKIIASFGVETYGQALFIPESRAWQALHPAK